MNTRIRTAGILVSEGHVLLESVHDVEVWMVPGGGLKPNETLQEGCVREYHEETGLEVSCGKLLCVHEHYWSVGKTVVREYGFYFEVNPLLPFDVTRPIIYAKENPMQFRWFSFEEIAGLSFNPEQIKPFIVEIPDSTVFITTKEEGVRRKKTS
jgi:8-oxo-dGTP pyrophosphatase MutT (NUDIX family)